jgi:hypothetical protein
MEEINLKLTDCNEENMEGVYQFLRKYKGKSKSYKFFFFYFQK